MYEMILAVGDLVGNYEITSAITPIKLKPLITLKPEQAILEFKIREGA
jgi:hypothetical protein